MSTSILILPFLSMGAVSDDYYKTSLDKKKCMTNGDCHTVCTNQKWAETLFTDVPPDISKVMYTDCVPDPQICFTTKPETLSKFVPIQVVKEFGKAVAEFPQPESADCSELEFFLGEGHTLPKFDVAMFVVSNTLARDKLLDLNSVLIKKMLKIILPKTCRHLTRNGKTSNKERKKIVSALNRFLIDNSDKKGKVLFYGNRDQDQRLMLKHPTVYQAIWNIFFFKSEKGIHSIPGDRVQEFYKYEVPVKDDKIVINAPLRTHTEL